jgi:hypothetical protein
MTRAGERCGGRGREGRGRGKEARKETVVREKGRTIRAKKTAAAESTVRVAKVLTRGAMTAGEKRREEVRSSFSTVPMVREATHE